MDLSNAYLRAILGGNRNALANPTFEEQLYVSSFYTEGELDRDRVYIELNKIISHIVTTDDKEMFFNLLDAIVAGTMFDMDYKIVDMIEPLMMAFRPRLSELLERSHLFCPCYAYRSGSVDQWNRLHETVEHELEFWKYFIETYREYIEFDVNPYTQKEAAKRHCSRTREHDRKEKMKQFYTCIAY